MPKAKSGRQTRLFLDGPSALMVYRGRADMEDQARSSTQAKEEVYDQFEGYVYEDGTPIEWLSDEAVAASLAAENALGHRSFVGEGADAADEDSHGVTHDALLPLRRSRVRTLRGCSARSREIKGMDCDGIGLLPRSSNNPLYLLVGSPEDRRPVKNTHVRVWGKTLPTWALMRAGEAVFVPTPEFTFLLLAQHLSVCELIAVGMELCGHYRLQRVSSTQLLQSERTLYSQSPLTRPEEIKRLLDRSDGMPGIRTARRALKYLSAGSASPMETALYMLLCLPRALGGYGLRRPILNVRRATTKAAKSLTFSKTLIPDLYWADARLDLEYDSEEFHADPASLERGARRTLALRVMGVDVVAATREVVYDAHAFESMVRLIAKALGQRVYAATPEASERRRDLRQVLLY